MESSLNPYSHLTAKERDKESFPVRWLYQQGLIKGKTLDFGCGFGKDVTFLTQNGINTTGYDKYYAPEYPTEKFDMLLCVYVLNVLLPEEQAEVMMSVSELLKATGRAYFVVRRDLKSLGFRTHKIHQKQTYQCNVKLPFKSVLSNDFCEIYEYQHHNQLLKKETCVFCSPATEAELVTELATVYSIYDKFPVSEGHTLVIPKKHSVHYFELSLREQTALWIMVNRVKNILTQKHKPDGFNVGFNVNAAAGQTVFHTHIHVIPRYKNDVDNPKGGVRNVILGKGDYTLNMKKNVGTKFKDKPKNVLVAIMNSKKDFLIAQKQLWYRIPVKSAPKNLREGIVKYLAFYHTKEFELEKFSIRWYAEVKSVNIVKRKYLFPDEPQNKKSEQEYYKLEFDSLLVLEEPIISKRNRRITFIPTTEEKFFRAKEINYLFADSIIEDKFWEALIENHISAERQFFLPNKYSNRFLDFAVFCKDGNIDIECDGDTFHSKLKDVKQDKIRNNEIASIGWTVLRFTRGQIDNELEEIINIVKNTVNKHGGMKDIENPKKHIFFPKDNEGQASLF
jgi:diadenosine tetraphosphate (Ap4A) HIT family hydrolase/very-short-patch-repair endonuclease